MRTPPVARQVTLRSVAVVVLTLAVASVVTQHLLHRHLEAELRDILRDRAAVVQDFAAAHPDASQLARLLGDRGLRVEVHDEDGRVYESQPAFPRIGSNLPVRRDDTNVLTTRIELPPGRHALVSVSRHGVDDSLKQLGRIQFAVAAVAAVIAAAVLGVTVRRRMQPLGDMAAVAQRISAGEHHHRMSPNDPTTALGKLGTALDDMVDHLQMAVANAQEAEERSQRFLADAAHQLRTPLARINLAAQTLPLAAAVQREQVAETVVQESKRSAAIITKLLRLARLDRSPAPNFTTADLADLVRRETHRAQDLAPLIAIRYAGPDTLFYNCDAALLTEAIANLLDNARRHAAREITVELTTASSHHQIEITDDGPGMTAQQGARAFERFASLDGKGGSGLGLPIARGAARSHGGDIVYAHGTFTLFVPAALESRRPSA